MWKIKNYSHLIFGVAGFVWMQTGRELKQNKQP
jgi:hypothetical protein